MRINVSGHLATRDPFVYTVAMDTINRYNNAIKLVFFLLIMANIITFCKQRLKNILKNLKVDVSHDHINGKRKS